MNKKERFMALSLVLIFTIQIVSAMDLELILHDTKSPIQESYSQKDDIVLSEMVPRLIDGNPTKETSSLAGSGSSIDVSPPKFDVDESNDTHYWVIDPTGQVDGYWIEIGSGFQELNSSRGQTNRHWYNETSNEYTFGSDCLVNKTGVVDETDWITQEEYLNRFIVRLMNGSIYTFETVSEINAFYSLIDNSTVWGVGYESFWGVMAVYLNFQDTDWGHAQLLYYPRLANGLLPSFNQPLYAIYYHLYSKVGSTWYDKILNDRNLYDTPSKNPRNTLSFYNDSDTIGFYYTTYGIEINGFTWDFKHGFKFNITDTLYHMIDEFRCRDRGFDDIGYGYEITTSPQSEGTAYEVDRFVLRNETHNIVVNVSQAWQAGTYLDDFYSQIDLVSQNNETMVFTFVDMENAGFTQKYLELHDQIFPNGLDRKVLLAGMYGYGVLSQDTWIEIDPETGTRYSIDTWDLYKDGSTWKLTSTTMQVGKYSTSSLKMFLSFDTGINVQLGSPYTSDVLLQLYLSSSTVDAGEGADCKVYNVGGNGDANTCKESSTTYVFGTNADADKVYIDTLTFSTYNTADTTKMETLTDFWGANRGDSEEYISFYFVGDGTEVDDYYIFQESSYTGENRDPKISFTYILPNTAPTASYISGMQNTYANKPFNTIITEHADVDGVADLNYGDVLFGLTGVWYGARYWFDTNTEDETGTIDWGENYGVSESPITNGFELTWNISLSWIFDYDDVDYDVYVRTYDDSAAQGYTGWLEAGTTTHESDLEIVSFELLIDTDYEYGGTMGKIDDYDWFKGGELVTASGSVEYEGSSQTFDSTYASGVDIELLYDGSGTGQIDSSISSGVFSDITYTPTSGSNDIDVTAYFDVVINDIPTSGSDVTDAGIQKDSKRDNQVPIATSYTHADSNTGTGYDPQNGYDDDLSAVYTINDPSDQSGSGLQSLPYSHNWNGGSYSSWHLNPSPSVSVADGDSADSDMQIRDNVLNVATIDGEDITIDDDAPTGFTVTWTRYTGYPTYNAYLSGSTIYYDSGDNDYFGFQINTGGTIGNSLYWKSEFDVDGVIDPKTTDTSGLPDSDNQYYLSAGSGTFIVRLVNNAGNWQEWTYTATADNVNPTLSDAMSAYGESGDTGEMFGVISTNTFYFSNSFDTDGTATFTAGGTDGGSDVYGIDFGSWGGDDPSIDTGSPYQGQYTVNNADTTGSITVTIYDYVGNSASGSITCTEDAVAPSVSITWNFVANNYAIKSGTDYGFTNIDYVSVQDTVSGLGAVYLNAYDHSASAWKTSRIIASGLSGDTGDKSYLDQYRYYTDTGETTGAYLDDEYDNNQDYFYGFADDMVGNRAGMSIYVRLDRAVPTSGSVVMESGVFYASITNDNTPLLTGSSYTDSGGSGVVDFNFAWRVNEGSWTYRGYTGSNTWIPTISTSSQNYDFEFRARDTVGNEGSWVFDSDNTYDGADPSFTNIGGSESSIYLFASSITTDYGYYSDNMGATLTDFNVIGDVTDNFGLEKADGTTHFSDTPSDSSITGTSDAFSLTYTINNGDQGSGTEVVTVTLYDQAGNYVTDQFTFYEDNTAPTITTTAESESSDYLYSGYGTVKQGFYGSQMGSGQPFTISGTGSDGSSGMSNTVNDDTSFGGNPSNSGSGTSWEFIYSIISSDNGEVTVTYTGYDHVGNSNTDIYTFYEDNTAPTGYSLALVADAADGGYTPVFGYYDDNSVDVDATDTGSITEGESGLSPTPYSFKTDLAGWSSYQSDDTYEYTGVSDGSRTCYVKVRDNVYNEGSDQTVGVVVDTDNPTGFTVTWSRHTGWSDDYHAYLSGSTLYYSNLENDYFNLLVNNDGTIQNSGYWKIRWDLNSIFETWEDDTDALPESKDFYYYDDTGVNFVIRIINNAGNYQSFDFTGTLDVTKPNSYALSLGSYYSSPGEDVIVSGSTTDGISGLLSSDCYEWWINPTRDYGTSYTTATQKTWSGVTDLYPVFYAAAWDNVGNWRNASEIMGSFFQIIFITDPQPEIEEIEVTEYYDPDDVFYDDLPLKVASIEPEEDDSKRESLTETDIQIPEEIFYDEIQDTKAESNNETDRLDESNNETDRIDESLNIITIRKTQLRWVLPSILSLMPIIIILRRKRVRRNLIE